MRQGSLRDVSGRYDLVVVNILARVIVEMVREGLSGSMRPDGVLIAAGITVDKVSDVAAAFERGGLELVDQILTIYNNYGFETEVIVASIRHPLHVVEAALIGADIATLPFASLEKLVKHPLTDIGIERFLSDWKKVQKR